MGNIVERVAMEEMLRMRRARTAEAWMEGIWRLWGRERGGLVKRYSRGGGRVVETVKVKVRRARRTGGRRISTNIMRVGTLNREELNQLQDVVDQDVITSVDG